MARFNRVALAFLLLVFSQLAHAAAPVTQYRGSWGANLGTWTISQPTAGAQAVSLRNSNCTNAICGTGWPTCTFTSVIGVTAYGNCPNPPAIGVADVVSRQWCPEFNVAPTAGVCPDPDPICPPKAGMSGGRINFDTGLSGIGPPPPLSTPRFVCIPTSGEQGCIVEMTPDLGTVSEPWTSAPAGSTTWTVQGPSKYTGGGCLWQVTPGGSTPDGSTSTQATPEGNDKKADVTSCPPGQLPGEVNGMTICANSGGPTVTKSTESGTTTTSTPGGTSTTSTTKTETTTCQAGVCTTITVVNSTPGTGSATSTTTTKTSGEGEFCASKPDDPQCQSDTEFGGTCVAGGTGTYTCTGDAVSCAIARAVNDAKCLLTPSPAAVTVANELAAGTFGAPLTNTVKNLGSFDQTNPFGSACPADQTFEAAGRSFTIKLSSVCSELQMMGNILVALCLFSATIFVLRGLGGN